jgi:tRNA-dihydrouridine synthase B
MSLCTDHTQASPGQKPEPTFWVRDVPVYGRSVLAPMAGFSDLPFRRVCRALGSAMSYTPFVSVTHLLGRTPRPSARRALTFWPDEHPILFQVQGTREDEIVAACVRIEAWGGDAVDLNLGCPTLRVTRGGGGAALLREPDKIRRIVARLTRALSVPVTAKIRLGWDMDERNGVEVARILEDAGVALIAVHGRTRAQGQCGPADWDAMAEIKAVLRIPVLANGGVHSAADADRLLAQTGCDGVMIGRAALGHPWIFSGRERTDVPREERLVLMRRHLGMMVDCYGPRRGGLHFRKHLVRYLEGVDGDRRVRRRLLSSPAPGDITRLLEAYLLP